MLLAIDVGNTNLTVGRFDREELVDSRRVKTTDAATVERLAAALDLADVDDAVLASVVPSVTQTVMTLCAQRGIRLLVADARTIPLPTRVDRPADVGADRLLNSFAAVRMYGAPVIVVDLGTATTFDVVDADGAFVGGAIAPGIGLGADALAARTALLPRIELALPDRAIGTDTVAALQSGVVLGYLGLVEKMLDRIETELGAHATVVVTGGLSNADWAKAIPCDVVDPDLTLRGLVLLHAEVAVSKATA